MTVRKLKLTKLQQNFAREVVLNGGDKVAAYKAAGYSWENFTLPALGVEAARTFSVPRVSLRVAELQAASDKVAKEQFNVDAEYVLRRLKEIDDLDVLDIVNDDLSGFRPLNEWPKAWRTSVSAIDLKRMVLAGTNNSIESVVEKIKWPDKAVNLERLGKHVNVQAFSDRLIVESTHVIKADDSEW